MQCIGGLESYGRKRRSLRHKAAKSLNSTSVELDATTQPESETRRNDRIQISF